MPKITNSLTIPDDELHFSAARASGPGGQHVNKTSTAVTLTFDVVNSPSLSDYQRARIMNKLGHRISRQGLLRITAQDTRSQTKNKASTVERFTTLLKQALKTTALRKKTRPTLASKRRRLDTKKRRSSIKRSRGRVSRDD